MRLATLSIAPILFVLLASPVRANQIPGTIVFDACAAADENGNVQYSECEQDMWAIDWEFCLEPGGRIVSVLGTSCGIDPADEHVHRLFENDSLVVDTRVIVNYTSAGGGAMRLETLLNCGSADGTTCYIIQISLDDCCIPTGVATRAYEDVSWSEIKSLFR